MFNFLKKKESSKLQKVDIISKTASLLIHAAKIDENYTNIEKEIIKKALINLNPTLQSEVEELLKKAEKKEHESNQIRRTLAARSSGYLGRKLLVATKRASSYSRSF